MEAADAFTVIPRSLSTFSVSKRVISSLISLCFGDLVPVSVDVDLFVVIADDSSRLYSVVVFSPN